MPAIQQWVLTFWLAIVVLGSGPAWSLGDEKDDPKHKGKRISAWIAQLKGKDESARLEAAATLGEIGQKAVVPLHNALNLDDFTLRQYAIITFGKIGRPAVPRLRDAMQSREDYLRYDAIKALGEIGHDAADAVPDLLKLMKAHGGRGEGYMAMLALGRIGKPAVEPLLDLLKRDRVILSDATILEALARVGPDATSAIPVLRAYLADGTSPLVRTQAAHALGNIGPAAKDTLPTLKAALTDEDELVRLHAKMAIKSIETTKRLPFTFSQIKKAIGPPSEKESDDGSFLDYEGRMHVSVGLNELEIEITDSPGGLDLATRFFSSRLFSEGETKALSGLLKARGGKREVGRLQIHADEARIEKRTLVIRILPGGKILGKDLPAEKTPKTEGSVPREFPITIAQITKELGPPDTADDDVLDYQDRINVRASAALNHLELMIKTDPAGLAFASKLFRSPLFTEAEGKAISDLLKAKGGEKAVGRFKVIVKESIGVERVLLVTIALGIAKAVAEPRGRLDREVVTSITPERLRKIAEGDGFTVVKIEKDMVKLKSDLVTVFFFVDGGRVKSILPLKGTKATAKRVNAFNAKPTTEFTAVLGEDGDAFFKGSLDLEGGVTDKTIGRYVSAFMKAAPRFVLEVCAEE